MPALTKCPRCKFTGSHGFNQNIPYMMSYYHTKPNGTCHWYSGFGRTFNTYRAAVMAVHTNDPKFDDLWVAYMLSSNPAREKLPRLHSKRCSGTGLTKIDRAYIESKGLRIVER